MLDGEGLTDASARCRAVYDGLAALYPMGENGGEPDSGDKRARAAAAIARQPTH